MSANYLIIFCMYPPPYFFFSKFQKGDQGKGVEPLLLQGAQWIFPPVDLEEKPVHLDRQVLAEALGEERVAADQPPAGDDLPLQPVSGR